MTIAEQKKPERRIPKFNSYQEEADFWDTHSPEDFPDEFEFDDSVTFAHPLEIVRVRDWRKILVDALSGLPENQRQALALNMLGLSAAEIARVTGWSATECQKALRAARRKTRGLARRTRE